MLGSQIKYVSNIVADGIIILCVVIGVLLILWPILKGARSIWTEQQMYKYTGPISAGPEIHSSTSCDHRETNSNAINSSSSNNKQNKSYNPLPFEDESQL